MIRPFKWMLVAMGLFVVSGLNLQAAGPKREFRDGETVCFLGDSITHGGWYIKLIGNYYITRYPDRNVKFVNCGISGDSLYGALGRYDTDVMKHRPDWLFVMLGMNDVDRDSYFAGKDKEARLNRQKRAIEGFARNLESLVAKIKASGVRNVVLMSPTIYEEYAVNDKFSKPAKGCDRGLAKITEIVKKTADENGYLFIDLHTAMLKQTKALQAKDPAFSFINGDRVHPGVWGHYLILAEILKAFGEPGAVAVVDVDATAKGTRVENCELSDLDASPTKVVFELETKSLPMLIDPRLPGVLKQDMAHLNRELLRIKGLAKGDYIAKIGDKYIGTFSAAQLASGVDLTMVTHTPQYQKAYKACGLNHARWQLEIDGVRDPMAAEKFLGYARRRRVHDKQEKLPGDSVKAAEVLLKENDKGYVPMLYKRLVKYGSAESHKQVLDKLSELQRNIYESNKPKPARYVVYRKEG